MPHRRISFRFSFRPFWGWWSFLILQQKGIKVFLRKSSIIENYFLYHFVFIVTIVLNGWRKHLSFGVRSTPISHVRIHHPVVMRMCWRMLLVSCRENKAHDNSSIWRNMSTYRVPIILGGSSMWKIGWKPLMGWITMRRHVIMIEWRWGHAGKWSGAAIKRIISLEKKKYIMKTEH